MLLQPFAACPLQKCGATTHLGHSRARLGSFIVCRVNTVNQAEPGCLTLMWSWADCPFPDLGRGKFLTTTHRRQTSRSIAIRRSGSTRSSHLGHGRERVKPMEKPDILLPARCVPGQHAGDWGVKLVRSASSPTDAAGSEASIEYVYVLFPVST